MLAPAKAKPVNAAAKAKAAAVGTIVAPRPSVR
jgi:hypothetical protein